MAEKEFETVETHLCGAIAAALARLIDGTAERDGAEGHCIANDDMLEYVRAAEALDALGVMRRQASAANPQHSWLVFAMNAEDMPSFLVQRIDASDPRIEPLLRAFMKLACTYSDLYDDTDWFIPPVSFGLVMELFAACGYAEQRGDRFCWAAKMAPIMQAEGIWDENGDCWRLRSEARDFRMAELIWTSMPDDLKRLAYGPDERFTGRKIQDSPPDVGRLIFLMGHYWNGTREAWEWDGFLKPETFKVLQGGHLGRALHIQTMIRSGFWRG